MFRTSVVVFMFILILVVPTKEEKEAFDFKGAQNRSIGSFMITDHEETKVTLNREKDVQTHFIDRVKRNTPHISRDVLNSIRMEVRNHILNLTASQFCQVPDKICTRGAPGKRGLRGRRGSRGRRGRPGHKGIKGLPGKYGKQGLRGFPGQKGQKGDIGNRGPPGLPGPKGERGKEVTEPSVLISPSTLTVTENQTATFHCNAHGYPKPQITWKMVSGKQIDFGKTRIDKSGLLEISNVSENDTGNYTCSAKSVLGEDANTVSLLVKFPPRFTEVQKPFQTILQGSTVNLKCAALGYPPPIITWTKMLGSLPTKRSQQNGGKLTITRFQQSDSGSYKCEAVNSVGKNIFYTTLSFGTCTRRKALGMQSKAIRDSQITASSSYNLRYLPSYGRLNIVLGNGGWLARSNTIGEWIQVDFLQATRITAIATQGTPKYDEWTSTYSLQHSYDGTSFRDYEGGKTLPGNSDRSTVVKNNLDPAITARYIRLLPKTYNNYMVIRMELYGCQL
ncbi:uncharacterized protein LOC110231617 isoform X6 [Exaiptasia diaphana]|uniref:Uncharacterized protein n=1 Tax=Exaiptasia diaphana TaxID=2652724 RepID=A0A913YDR1_EXADI|nr:uncharacterized protein LOC110231617 isoform X6 [Exaiptasia diaphana]